MSNPPRISLKHLMLALVIVSLVLPVRGQRFPNRRAHLPCYETVDQADLPTLYTAQTVSLGPSYSCQRAFRVHRSILRPRPPSGPPSRGGGIRIGTWRSAGQRGLISAGSAALRLTLRLRRAGITGTHDNDRSDKTSKTGVSETGPMWKGALLDTGVASFATAQQVFRTSPAVKLKSATRYKNVDKLDGSVVAVRDITGLEWNSADCMVCTAGRS